MTPRTRSLRTCSTLHPFPSAVRNLRVARLSIGSIVRPSVPTALPRSRLRVPLFTTGAADPRYPHRRMLMSRAFLTVGFSPLPRAAVRRPSPPPNSRAATTPHRRRRTCQRGRAASSVRNDQNRNALAGGATTVFDIDRRGVRARRAQPGRRLAHEARCRRPRLRGDLAARKLGPVFDNESCEAVTSPTAGVGHRPRARRSRRCCSARAWRGDALRPAQQPAWRRSPGPGAGLRQPAADAGHRRSSRRSRPR